MSGNVVISFFVLPGLETGYWRSQLGFATRLRLTHSSHSCSNFKYPCYPSSTRTLHLPLPLLLLLPCYRYCGELAIKMSGQFNTNKLSDCLGV